MLDHRRDVDDVLLMEQLFVAHLQVELTQQKLHAHSAAETSQQRHTLQAIVFSGTLYGVTVDTKD